MKILLTVDGSAYTKRMLGYVAVHDELLGAGNEYTIFIVVPPIPPHATHFVDRNTLDDYYRETAEEVLQPIRAFAAQKGWQIKVEHAIGQAAEKIAALAESEKHDLSMAVGAVTGTVAGAIRDFWVAGVDLDFVEEAEKMLQAGKAALVGEVDEEWVVPVDSALEAAGGAVYRRTRSEVVDAHFDHGIAVFKGEIEEFEAEAANATGMARTKLQTQIVAAKAGLERAVLHAKQRVEALKHEADGNAVVLKEQVSQAKGGVKATLEDRVKRVKSAYHVRGAKLSQAWGLTKTALAV